ncbi:MAG: DUF1287 domain-containing protein [Clostridia bacterium]
MKKGIIIGAIITILIFLVSAYISIFYIKDFKNYYSNEDFDIEKYISTIDKDGDGIDDQTDILNNVREYISKNPKYKSQYYNTGYPNDEYGVCTDVIAFGCLGAGYNLMELVNEDIMANPQNYNIENIDKNIDFRRVKNLKVYLDNNTISLTTDIYDIDKWQGGDIIVFEKHIGIVSDKRNSKGIPYVIHHANPYQLNYEEDFLEYRNDIVGHYRIS